MKIRHETGLAVNILVALGAQDKGYTRNELGKKIYTYGAQFQRTLSELHECGLVNITKVPEKPARFIYTIAKPADEIKLDDIFELYEGEFLNSVCLLCRKGCRNDKNIEQCQFVKELATAMDGVQNKMKKTTIQDLIATEQKACENKHSGGAADITDETAELNETAAVNDR